MSQSTQNLFESIFGRADLFDGLPRICRRVVAWGTASPVTLPHSGIVVSESALLERMREPDRTFAGEQDDADWTIHTATPLPEGSVREEFGDRTATASFVKLSNAADPEACITESGENGWLFLLPMSNTEALLITAGCPQTELLENSSVVAKSVEAIIGQAGSFPAYPRMASPVCGSGWVACGSAAIGFDPLCGDGSGYALREAILACAVVRHRDTDTPADNLLWEYKLRSLGAFRKHLSLCLQFYSTGGISPWWQEQCRTLQKGIEWTSNQQFPAGLQRLRLNEYELERIDAQ